MMQYHVHIFSRLTLGLVFWAWEIARVDDKGKLHVEVTGLNSNSYKGACDAVERELNQHYRVMEPDENVRSTISVDDTVFPRQSRLAERASIL